MRLDALVYKYASTELSGSSVGARRCLFIGEEDLCCAAAQHRKVCGFLATDAANIAGVLLTKTWERD